MLNKVSKHKITKKPKRKSKNWYMNTCCHT